jgi:hypothetical protein
MTYFTNCDSEEYEKRSLELKFLVHLKSSEELYMDMAKEGLQPQQLKRLFPLGAKAELRLCGFKDAWKNFFWRRCAEHADPECIEVANKINEILCNSTDISQYEGGIISGKMDDIWEFILNTIKLKNIAPLIHLDGEIDLNKINEGDEIQMFYDNHNKNFMIKCKLKEKKDNWNKWFIIFHLFSGNPKIPEQELIIELTKINNNDCQLILFTKYFEPEINENIQKISQNKKYIINSIKDYLENYKC